MVHRDILFVKSRIRKYIKDQGFSVSHNVLEGFKLDHLIKDLLDIATERAKINKRKTVRGHDLYIKLPPIKLPLIKKDVLMNIITVLKKSKINERGIMYYDIVNYIIRNKHEEEDYDQIMLWCNANIKNGHTFYREI